MWLTGNRQCDKKDPLATPEMDTFTLSLCSQAEKDFIHGCNYLLQGYEMRALGAFRSTARSDPGFFDAWFMVGLLQMKFELYEEARQAFLNIVKSSNPFYGVYIIKFMPRIRLMFNFFEDFTFQVMPTTGDVAAILGRIYLIEGKVREAKKVLHPAFKEYHDNIPIKVVWAQSMLMSDTPDEIIEKIDMKIPVHKGNHEIDLVLTYVIGQAYLMRGDFRLAISHMESVLHYGQKKDPRLMDCFKINIAKVYEKEGFLVDALEIVEAVKDQTLKYNEKFSVEMKRGWFLKKIDSYRKQGIVKPIEFTYTWHDRQVQESTGFLEFKRHAQEG